MADDKNRGKPEKQDCTRDVGELKCRSKKKKVVKHAQDGCMLGRGLGGRRLPEERATGHEPVWLCL